MSKYASNIPEKSMNSSKNIRIKSEISDESPATFDKYDLAILRELLADSRRTLQEIGDAVKLSPTTCWSRIKRMQSEGIIRKYSVELDRTRLGYKDTVVVQLTLESHTDETLYQFGRTLAEIPEVLDAYLVSGDYDYFIRIAVKDTRDYERLLRERLYKIPGIRHSKSSFVLRVLKDGNVPGV
jgi:Lrp/AsnC family leucine-responsive transcriptional regulator